VPFMRSQARGATKPRIEVQAFIPQPAGLGDLGSGAPEEYRAKARYTAGIAQRLQDQRGRLTAVDADIGRGSQKLGLGPGCAPIVVLVRALMVRSVCAGLPPGRMISVARMR
jgi:hypothetical protein